MKYNALTNSGYIKFFNNSHVVIFKFFKILCFIHLKTLHKKRMAVCLVKNIA